ncbi:hypothetical protein, partial [Mobilibacterium timonense]|uniref:hypothetical protein n=1 Tax=Mobilibacterium timonense TaxID=1871012 RepID=UPI003A93EAAA
LTDTGAGFWEGSTDITRTYVLGPITQQMKDDPKYANKAVEKLNEYEINGFHLGHQLIATFESADHPLDIELVEGIISDIAHGKWTAR